MDYHFTLYRVFSYLTNRLLSELFGINTFSLICDKPSLATGHEYRMKDISEAGTTYINRFLDFDLNEEFELGHPVLLGHPLYLLMGVRQCIDSFQGPEDFDFDGFIDIQGAPKEEKPILCRVYFSFSGLDAAISTFCLKSIEVSDAYFAGNRESGETDENYLKLVAEQEEFDFSRQDEIKPNVFLDESGNVTIYGHPDEIFSYIPLLESDG